MEILRLLVDEKPGEYMHRLWEAEIFPICAPNSLIKLQRFPHPEELLEQELNHIVGYRNDGHRWARLFASSDVTVPAGLMVDGLNIGLDAACSSEGIVLGRSPMVDIYLENGQLVRAIEDEASLFASDYLRVNTLSSNWRITRILTDRLIQGDYQG